MFQLWNLGFSFIVQCSDVLYCDLYMFICCCLFYWIIIFIVRYLYCIVWYAFNSSDWGKTVWCHKYLPYEMITIILAQRVTKVIVNVNHRYKDNNCVCKSEIKLKICFTFRLLHFSFYLCICYKFWDKRGRNLEH